MNNAMNNETMNNVSALAAERETTTTTHNGYATINAHPRISAFIRVLFSKKLRELWDDGWAVIRARWYFRRANEVGPKVRVWGRPHVRNWGRMVIGGRLRLVSTVATVELVAMPGATIEIGENTFINYGTSIAAKQLIRIGADCSIGTQVIIMDNNYHHLEPERRNEPPDSAPVILEENVWIGARAIILPGVVIGRDSVIGAGSVVTKSVPPRALVAGVPAKVIRFL